MNKGGNTGIILVLYIRIRRFPFFILVSFFRRKRRKSMTVYDELVARGLIAQVTDEEEIEDE